MGGDPKWVTGPSLVGSHLIRVPICFNVIGSQGGTNLLSSGSMLEMLKNP